MDGADFIPKQAERSGAFDRVRAGRAAAFEKFRSVKAKMRNTNSWDHYEMLSKYLLIAANEHRAYTRILIKNGVN